MKACTAALLLVALSLHITATLGQTAPQPSDDTLAAGCSLELNANYNGTLIRNFTASSASECSVKCRDVTGCNIFVYCGVQGGCDNGYGSKVPYQSCNTKIQPIALGGSPQVWSRGPGTPFTSGQCAASTGPTVSPSLSGNTPAPGCTVETNANYNGTLIQNFTVASVSLCSAKCKATIGCNIYVYCSVKGGCDNGYGNLVPFQSCNTKIQPIAPGGRPLVWSRGPDTPFTSGQCTATVSPAGAPPILSLPFAPNRAPVAPAAREGPPDTSTPSSPVTTPPPPPILAPSLTAAPADTSEAVILTPEAAPEAPPVTSVTPKPAAIPAAAPAAVLRTQTSPKPAPKPTPDPNAAPGPITELDGCQLEASANYNGTFLGNVTAQSVASCAARCGSFKGCNIFVYCGEATACDDGLGEVAGPRVCTLKNQPLSVGVGVEVISRGAPTNLASGFCVAKAAASPKPLPPAASPLDPQPPGTSPTPSPPSAAQGPAPGPASGTTTFIESSQQLWSDIKNRVVTCDAKEAPKAQIISNSTTTAAVYPYLVSLRDEAATAGEPGSPAHFCGGILLFGKVIMTAAHCCLQNKSADTNENWIPQYANYGGSDATIKNPPTAVIGATCVNDPGVDSQNVSFALVHPLWNGDYKNGYDVCLMFMERPFKVSKPSNAALASNGDTIGSVFPKLPRNSSWTSDNPNPLPYQLQAVGWGESGPNGERSPQLKNTTLVWQTPRVCQSFVQSSQGPKIPFKDNQICASSNIGATCSGDSGGPLLYSPSGGRDPSSDIVIGIVSYGPGQCQLQDSWTVFTDVQAFNRPDVNDTCKGVYKPSSVKDAWISCTLQKYNFDVSQLAPQGEPSLVAQGGQ